MSNLTGSYRISIAEVQPGVDSVREQERLARMQLLDDIKIQSPQPIFGEPVKVDLEDETSIRLKNTLGDFNQMLVNDPKNLMSISRSIGHTMSNHPSAYPPANGHPSNGYSSAAHPPSGHMSTSHPHMGHPPTSSYSSNAFDISGTDNLGHTSSSAYNRSQPPPTFKKPSNVVNGSKSSIPHPNYHAQKDKRTPFNRPDKPGYNYKPDMSATSKVYSQPQTAYLQKTPHTASNKDPKRVFPPQTSVNHSIMPNANQHLPTSASIYNCGPETPAIQVAPFHLPSNVTPSVPKKPVPSYGEVFPSYSNSYASAASVPAAKSSEPANPQPKRTLIRPSSLKFLDRKPNETPIPVETILKEMTKVVPSAPLTAIQTPRTEETGFTFPGAYKEDNPFTKFGNEKFIQPIQPIEDPLPRITSQNSPKPWWKTTETEKPKIDTTEKPKPTASVPTEEPKSVSSLEDDLNLSDSDDEAVAETKVDSTVKTTEVKSSIDNMDAKSDSSNSSDSGDSDSDSSSESNDSDSPDSDEEVSSKKWGLSNFVVTDQKTNFYNNDVNRTRTNPVVNNFLDSTKTSTENKNPLSPASESAAFLVPEVPVAPPKSEILSPISSPVHPGPIGPRTPPSPPSSNKQSSPETNVDDIETGGKDLPPVEVASESLDKTTLQTAETQSKCDTTEQSFSLQDEKPKKLLRTNKIKCLSGDSQVERDKERTETTEPTSDIKKASDKGLFTPTREDNESNENYSIKTRQRITSSSSKKTKASLDISKDNEKKEKGDSTESAKGSKHPRACRKKDDKPIKKDKPSTSKSNACEDHPKQIQKQAPKLPVSNSERSRDSVKEHTSNDAKSSIKSKSKPSKLSTKNKPEEKVEVKKNKKFAIENFLQMENSKSPSPSLASSPEEPAVPKSKDTEKASTENSDELSSNSKGVQGKPKVKKPNGKVGKLRRSIRCSERASSISQAAPIVEPFSPSTDKADKSVTKITHKSENSSVSSEHPLGALSILQDSAKSLQSFGFAIPFSVLVSIPLSKLLRIPSKPKLSNKEESTVKISEKNIDKDKPSGSKSSQSKISKEKLKPTVPVIKTEKLDSLSSNAKPNGESAIKSKSLSSVKSGKNKESSSNDDKVVKKRKSEIEEKSIGKKAKILPKSDEKKISRDLTTTKTDSSSNQTENASKVKPLERCDSTGSLSSLCSQQSQRSLKSSKERKKDSLSGGPESKKIKTSGSPLITSKDVKQEKEDRTKNRNFLDVRIPDKSKNKSKEKIVLKDSTGKDQCLDENVPISQCAEWEDIGKEDCKVKLEDLDDNIGDMFNREFDKWDHFAPEMHKELKETSTLNKHNNQAPIMPMDYYFTEAKKQTMIAEKERNLFQQAVKLFEAAVLYILTSQQREEYGKDPESVYNFYSETLKFSSGILKRIKRLQACPGSTEFKLLILCLKCQALLYIKLYSLKIKEVKEKLDGCSKFLQNQSTVHVKTLGGTQSKISNFSFDPHSPIPSSTTSINPQNSSSELNGGNTKNLHFPPVSIPQNILDMICTQHTHLINLHNGHDLWEQADMYMTRSNLREFFKEVADQSEPLTLHSSITELVKYTQKAISLIKRSMR